MQIGPYRLDAPLLLAPMAGITDRPFRQLCREQGAALTVSEMLSSNPQTWNTKKSQGRIDYRGESGIRAVQIAGSDPGEMAAAAQMCVDAGAQIIDINMGCPAKKVNKKLAGSALLKDLKLVEAILNAVVSAVPVPVTLKTRTGWDPEHKNGIDVATIAEQCGIQALTIHGRTRACLYKGEAEYDTISSIVERVTIPVIANGDIDSPHKAKRVLQQTGAAAVMIGRAAQGQPWLFAAIRQYLQEGTLPEAPSLTQIEQWVCCHIDELHQFYGPFLGVRIARKHVGWYLEHLPAGRLFRRQFNTMEHSQEQLDGLRAFFQTLTCSKAS